PGPLHFRELLTEDCEAGLDAPHLCFGFPQQRLHKRPVDINALASQEANPLAHPRDSGLPLTLMPVRPAKHECAVCEKELEAMLPTKAQKGLGVTESSRQVTACHLEPPLMGVSVRDRCNMAYLHRSLDRFVCKPTCLNELS